MKIIAESTGDIKVNEDLNFGLFAVPRPTRDGNGTFIISPEDVAPDMRATMLKLEDIDTLKLRDRYREEIKKYWSSLIYSVRDAFGTTWVIVPFPDSGKTILYSCN